MAKSKKSAPVAAKKAPVKAAPKAAPKRAATKKTVSSEEDSSMLEEFMLDSIKDIYWAEKHLTKTLPKLIKAATTEEIKTVFQDHLAATQEHAVRLEQVFSILGKKAQAKKCDAMDGITKEAESIIEETEKGTKTRDVALIMAAQKVEHYEIATYGGLVQISKTLGKNDIADILAQTLQEEKDTDHLLSEIAENNINMEASQESE